MHCNLITQLYIWCIFPIYMVSQGLFFWQKIHHKKEYNTDSAKTNLANGIVLSSRIYGGHKFGTFKCIFSSFITFTSDDDHTATHSAPV